MWYVLHVITGQELEVSNKLHFYGIKSIVPIENRVIRTKGKWKQAEYILLPGYVFVETIINDDFYYLLNSISGVIKILPANKSPTPLSERDVQWLICLDSCLRNPNTIKYLDDYTYQIVSGFLKYQSACIEKIDRHRRRICINFPLFGESKKIELSYMIASL